MLVQTGCVLATDAGTPEVIPIPNGRFDDGGADWVVAHRRDP